MEQTGGAGMRSRRIHSALNVATVGLLAVIAVAFIFMPRHNYAVLASGIAALEAKTAALENGFQKLNILAGPEEEKRAAVLANIDSITSGLRKLDTDLVSFLENLAGQSSTVEEVLRRLRALEDGRQGTVTSTGANEEVELRSSSLLEKLEKAVSKAAEFPSQAIAEMNFEEFLGFAHERGLISFSGNSLEDRSLPQGGRREKVKPVFESYRACVETINRSEQLLIEELVERGTRMGQYVEEADSGERRNAVEAPPEAGTVFVKNLGGGRKRVFRLTAEEHPGFLQFEALREKALVSLILSLAAISDHSSP